jgi:hypothetical protein
MRDEIRRLAAEDGRSMNAQIIELLDFALKNSGTDIDEIHRMLSAQRIEMAALRRQLKLDPQAEQSAPTKKTLTDADLEAVQEAVWTAFLRRKSLDSDKSS